MPVQTIAVGLGLPGEDQRKFFDWAVGMTSDGDMLGSSATVAEYIAPLIVERREHPTNDLLSILAEARIEDADAHSMDDSRPLTDDEINSFVRLLIIAGAGTTYKAYGNLMFMLLSHPDQLATVRADRSLVPQAIDESLRIEQPLASVQRVANADTSVGGVDVAAGCPVAVNIGAANHDPAQWGTSRRVRHLPRAARPAHQLRLRHPPLSRHPPRACRAQRPAQSHARPAPERSLRPRPAPTAHHRADVQDADGDPGGLGRRRGAALNFSTNARCSSVSTASGQ